MRLEIVKEISVEDGARIIILKDQKYWFRKSSITSMSTIALAIRDILNHKRQEEVEISFTPTVNMVVNKGKNPVLRKKLSKDEQLELFDALDLTPKPPTSTGNTMYF
jgi:hypothetical protein